MARHDEQRGERGDADAVQPPANIGEAARFEEVVHAVAVLHVEQDGGGEEVQHGIRDEERQVVALVDHRVGGLKKEEEGGGRRRT